MCACVCARACMCACVSRHGSTLARTSPQEVVWRGGIGSSQGVLSDRSCHTRSFQGMLSNRSCQVKSSRGEVRDHTHLCECVCVHVRVFVFGRVLAGALLVGALCVRLVLLFFETSHLGFLIIPPWLSDSPCSEGGLLVFCRSGFTPLSRNHPPSLQTFRSYSHNESLDFVWPRGFLFPQCEFFRVLVREIHGVLITFLNRGFHLQFYMFPFFLW